MLKNIRVNNINEFSKIDDWGYRPNVNPGQDNRQKIELMIGDKVQTSVRYIKTNSQCVCNMYFIHYKNSPRE